MPHKFEKGHKKLGGRAKGTRNKVNLALEAVVEQILPPEELERRWRKLLDSDNEFIALRALEVLMSWRWVKPLSPDAKHATPPLIIDVPPMFLPAPADTVEPPE